MKPINSFEEAVKRTLVSQPVNTVSKKKKTKAITKRKQPVKEAYNSPGSVTTDTRGQMPPYSQYSDWMKMNIGGVDMRDIGKVEDDKSKSVQKLAYPLETTKDILGQSYLMLLNVANMIKQASSSHNPGLSDAKLKELKNLENIFKSVFGNMKKIEEIISQMTVN
jgi:hypothetical protein